MTQSRTNYHLEPTIAVARAHYEFLQAILQGQGVAYPDSLGAVNRVLSCLDQLEEAAVEFEKTTKREVFPPRI